MKGEQTEMNKRALNILHSNYYQAQKAIKKMEIALRKNRKNRNEIKKLIEQEKIQIRSHYQYE